jgi:hypothetical protein
VKRKIETRVKVIIQKVKIKTTLKMKGTPSNKIFKTNKLMQTPDSKECHYLRTELRSKPISMLLGCNNPIIMSFPKYRANRVRRSHNI